MEELLESFPHREDQINVLWKLLYKTNASELVHVFGFPGTGKTSVVRAVLGHREEPWIYINCHECSSARRLLERIILEISALSVSAPDGVVGKPRNRRKVGTAPHRELENGDDDIECKSSCQFIEQYQKLCKKMFVDSVRIVCVLDNVDRLHYNPDDDPFTILCRLSEFTDHTYPLVLVTISEMPWQKLFTGTRFAYSGSPAQIAFSNYTKAEMLDVLVMMKTRRGRVPVSSYRAFVTMILDLFYSACQDVVELDYQAWKRWDVGRLSDTSRRIWEQQIYRNAGQSEKELFLRNSNNACQMAKICKYLLVAAFLASYNPTKADKRFFLKQRNRDEVRTRIGKSSRSAYRQRQLLMGPKPFTLERLLMIYRCLAKNDEQLGQSDGLDITNQLLNYVTTLVKDNLLQMISGAAMLDAPKYRCLADLELVNDVAKTINVGLKARLVDFVDAV